MWSVALPAIAAVFVAALPAVTSERVHDRPSQPSTRQGDQVVAPLLPAGFSDAVVATVNAPTALTWTPDGRMLVTSKAGRVIVRRQDGTQTTALNISATVCDDTERGLVGIAVDPAFEVNHFVYLYYTREVRGACGVENPNPVNRVSRFVLGDDDSIAGTSEKVIVDHIASPRGHHIAGDLEFGADGYLYISVGDGICSLVQRSHCGPTNDNSQRPRLVLGKILRVTRDGLPAPTNPYATTPGSRRCTRPAGVPPGTGPCKEIFASGFRNPFRFARKPGTNLFYVNDVGQDTWEEVNRLRRGRNYGWNVREGHCRRASTTDCGPAGRFTNPIHDYRHRDDCRSITGGAFVPAGVWPGWDGSYLYGDFACGRIFRLVPRADGGFGRSTFMSGAEGPVHLRFGPHGDQKALYYLSYFTNTVHRIALTRGNTEPVADFTYTPDGLSLVFSGAASSDPDSGDRITRWAWDFGDGTSAVTTTPRTSHTYAAEGPMQVGLTVTDSRGQSSTTTFKTVHAGEHPPTVSITRPGPDARFAVGQTVDLAAEAADAEDGTLPASAVTWTLLLRHANHFHPHFGPVTGGSVTTAYPPPENLRAGRTSRLVAVAEAVDSHGLTARARLVLLPRTVALTFRTSPAGGRLLIQGELRRTPVSLESWVRYVIPVRAPDQRIGGVPHVFRSWSDGRNRLHDIVSPAVPTEYVARFRRR
jgi:glucose/arabinose dehydrogenase/PKD repeat protein